MKFLARHTKPHAQKYDSEAELPYVSILMAAYNEELVLEDKINSLLAQDYPRNKVRLYIGSDNSSDRTNAILDQHSSEYLTPVYFTTRQGKPSIINQLAEQALSNAADGAEHLFLLTDASVMLETDTLFKLAQHFKNPQIGLVDAHMIYTGMKEEGISKSENRYLSSEVQLKQNEAKLWGKMMGPFGGCFVMRAALYSSVPSNFLVDDFYLSLKVLEQGYSVINEIDAKCYEQVSHEMSEEFRRKKRISTGNFQNLNHFKSLLNPFTKLGFVFISHKVIRWLGPFLMLAIFFSSLVLALSGSLFYTIIYSLQLVWYLFIPMLDKTFSIIGIPFSLARHIRYFNRMNWALLRGFFAYMKGVEKGIWQPTKRS